MAKLSKIEVEKIAQLARIKLTEKEKEKFSLELSEILNYVEKINKVQSASGRKNIQETSQVTDLENVYRKDKAIKRSKNEAMQNREELLKNAPVKQDGYIKVRAVLE